MTLGFMLAASSAWYLPALFLGCFSWVFAPFLHSSLQSRPFVLTAYRWFPPLLVAGLLVSRALDLVGLEPNHPEVALVLGQNASLFESLQVLFTGQGATEGGLLALLVFSIFSPRLPSVRHATPATSAYVESRMMAFAGCWSLVSLVMLFEQGAYSALDVAPTLPTMQPSSWSVLILAGLITLLLIMSGEILTASAWMSMNGETDLLFKRAIMKTVVVASIAWFWLFQTEMFTDDWWSRPMAEPRLSFALLVTVYATWMVITHALATVLEGLQEASSSQAKALGLCVGAVALTSFFTVSSIADTTHVYGTGVDAQFVGWRWAAFLLFTGVAAMVLPLAGFDAAHHPEAWWFRTGLVMFVPLATLSSSGGWLLLPALLQSGAIYLIVQTFVLGGQHTSRRLPLLAVLLWALLLLVMLGFSTSKLKLLVSVVSIASSGAIGFIWFRHERNPAVEKQRLESDMERAL